MNTWWLIMYKYERLYIPHSPVGYMSVRRASEYKNRLLVIFRNNPIKLEYMKIYEDEYPHTLKDILK